MADGHAMITLERALLKPEDAGDIIQDKENNTGLGIMDPYTKIMARWVAQAWELVQSEMICKCFRMAGILDKEFAVVYRPYEEEDPFEDLDSLNSSELKDLINQITPTDAECSLDQYISGDKNIPVCFEHENEKWEEQFLHPLSPQHLYPFWC